MGPQHQFLEVDRLRQQRKIDIFSQDFQTKIASNTNVQNILTHSQNTRIYLAYLKKKVINRSRLSFHITIFSVISKEKKS